MRDPLSWSIPLFRVFGIQVRLHILYIVITLGFILREATKNPDTWIESVLIWVVVLFIIVLLHEFGHCFAARREGGEANEILMWPLGGLAYCDVPHVARAHLVTVIGGPLVNVMICFVCAAVLIFAKFLPPLNPLNAEHIYRPQLHNWEDGETWYKDRQAIFRNDITGERIDPRGIESAAPVKIKLSDVVDSRNLEHAVPASLMEKEYSKWFVRLEGSKIAIPATPIPTVNHYDGFILWTARIFWMSWMLLLFNLLPAFPLDGGRLLQCLIWARSGDFRRGTITAVYSGFAVALFFIVLSLWQKEPLLFGMAVFIWIMCRQQYISLEMSENESVFGYDFSQGYTSLEKDEPPRIKPKKPGPVKRWLAARREKKAQLEAEQCAADEARMDELLDKIHRLGKETLSDEERRFMDRVSARYRNRS